MEEMLVNDSSEQRIQIKEGRYGNRKRLQIQRLQSIESDGEYDNTTNINNMKNKKKSNKFFFTIPQDGYVAPQPPPPPQVGILVEGGGDGELPKYPCVSHGSVSMCGRRRSMEDAVTILPGFLTNIDFFGVYDGHGGAGVAYLCRDRLHRILGKDVENMDVEGESFDWKKVMEGCFMKMDGEVDGRGCEIDQDMKSIGSTALVALVSPEKVVVANCGDSRAVVSRGGVAVPLSHDHKPDRPDELERVEAAGGRVINWNGFRVLGVLATSRSIGDHYLKPYVISEPEVIVMDRTEDDEFLILATDGLWDVISNEIACQVVRRCFNGRIGRRCPGAIGGACGAAEAAAVLAELALARGSKDNISVVVIELKKLSNR